MNPGAERVEDDGDMQPHHEALVRPERGGARLDVENVPPAASAQHALEQTVSPLSSVYRIA